MSCLALDFILRNFSSHLSLYVYLGGHSKYSNIFIHIRWLENGGKVYAFPTWEESFPKTLMLWSSLHGLDRFNWRKNTWPQMDVATRREWSKSIKFIFIYEGKEIKFTRIKLKVMGVDWEQVHKNRMQKKLRNSQ